MIKFVHMCVGERKKQRWGKNMQIVFQTETPQKLTLKFPCN